MEINIDTYTYIYNTNPDNIYNTNPILVGVSDDRIDISDRI